MLVNVVTKTLHDANYLQAEIYKEDFMKEQQEKERLRTKNQMLEDKFKKMSTMPQVNVKLSFWIFCHKLNRSWQLKSVNISAPSLFQRDPLRT